MKRFTYILLIMSCISLQVSAMKFVSGQMICEVTTIVTDDCCSHRNQSSDDSDQDCDGICACCITSVAADHKVLYFEYLVSIGYLKHNTVYQEDCAQMVISILEEPPRGKFNFIA